MKEAKSRAQRQKREALLRKMVKIALTASIVLFLAVFFAFIPFRLLLPAYKLTERGEGELRLHFLDIQGGVTIVEFPDGEALVINAGEGSFAEDNRLCRYLRGLDITSLSVMATTGSTSHIGGMPALYEVFDIKTTYLPLLPAATGAWERFQSAVQKEECQTKTLVRYGVIENGSGAYAVCLSPYSQEEEGATREECSTVLYLSYEGVGVVLAGDMTQKRENRLVEEYRLLDSCFDSGGHRVRLENTQILCAASHGADSGSGENWLSLLSPSATVICCNQNEHPSDSALQRIASHSETIYRTDELGVVMVTIKDGNFTVTPHAV